MKVIGLLTFILFINLSLYSQKAPFNKGVNLTNWFQVGSAQQIQFSKYTRTDFEHIKSLGCDVVRLPINLHFMTNGTPNYTLDPLFLNFLDEVISWAEELDLHLIIDNHTFDSATDTDPNVGQILLKVWAQMAEHYKNTSNKIYFEVLNEPHGITDALWNSIQLEVVRAIRKIDTKHTLIVGPASWNSYNNLKNMPVYADDNLIYTFHFYDPFIFTHQGASWSGMNDLGGIPFPYKKEKMPEFPESMKSHWSYGAYNDYSNKGTIDEVHRLIDIAIAFQKQRNVPIYCGEFGVYDENSPNDDRTFWYKVVSEYFKTNNIAWTIWDYHGGFGIYNKGGNGQFEHDLNVPVVEAIGLKAPAQTPFILMPDSAGFCIYDDYPGKNTNSSSATSGEMNFYSTNRPNNGNYCIQWSGAAQYNYITFNFSPNKDFSFLAANNFALDLFVRSNNQLASFDIRFVDSKANTEDHPWRNRIVLDNSIVEWNGEWQHLHLLLSEFTEHGSWDNAWYNAAGLFDWKAIDKLEIVAESQPMGDGILWLDNIYISDQDTAKVNMKNGINKNSKHKTTLTETTYSANYKLITVKNNSNSEIYYNLFDLLGKIMTKGHFNELIEIKTYHLPPGLYILQLSNNKQITTEKIRID